VPAPPGHGDEAGDPQRALAELGAALAAAVVAAMPGWVEREVARVTDAWVAAGGSVVRPAVSAAAGAAGRRAAAAVAHDLEALLSADVDAQATTPLAVVRGAVVFPTAVLADAGVPAVERDRFAEERFPDDVYGLVPGSLGALDPALADPSLAWGAAKARAHRARHR